jgi:16S rRNA (guanine966-N2)-methyltransferase
MRIIAGQFRGRVLESPKSKDIRPTSDKVRGAIFNALQSRLDFENITALDLCCGTGALGLEALSRGAAFCTFVDQSPGSIVLTKKNAKTLGIIEACDFLTVDITKLKQRPSHSACVDLFFCDPPYAQGLIEPALNALIKGYWLAEDAIGVLECEKNHAPIFLDGFEVISEKIYGDTKIILVRYI